MPTFIDLFAGCGGFSSGLRAAGWTAVAEVEIDNWACASLRKNFPESNVIEADIRAITDDDICSLGPVDLIVGGPPCQGFSVAGSTQFGIDDPRNELFRWFLHWVQLLRPSAALIENVPAILSRQTNGATVLKAIEDALGPLGYSTHAKVLNSADFGVPQARRRAFIVMGRTQRSFDFPSPTHGAAPSQNDLFQPLTPYVTVGDALSDLPVIEAGEGSDAPVPYAASPANNYQVSCRAGQPEVANHIAMKHTSRLVERFKIIKPGQSLKDVPRSHGQIANHTGEKVSKPFKYNNYRLDPGKPALAIPASFQSLFLHPSLHRNLTAREAARLMGFPDSFVFCGKRTTMSWEKNLSQYNQIGNAVCPPVATALGKSLLRYVEGADSSSDAMRNVVSITRQKLTSAAVPAKIESSLPHEVVEELRLIAATLGESSAVFRMKGAKIPSAALPLALILAEAELCPLCSQSLAPNGRHEGEFCFLISKDGNDSLLENEQDHGLDYHIRVALGLHSQVGHFVGERLSELGFAELTSVQNPRSGRNVRGMRISQRGRVGSDVANRVLDALQRSLCPNESGLSIAVG